MASPVRRNLLFAGPGAAGGIAIQRIAAAAAAEGIVIGDATAVSQVLNLSGTTAITLPTHSDGDLLIAFLGINKSDLSADEIRIDVGGWVRETALDEEGVGGSVRTLKVYAKFASGEGATVDVQNDTAVARSAIIAIIAIAGVDATKFDVTPVDAHAKDQINTLSPQAPAITSLTDASAMIIYNILIGETFTTLTQPAGYDDDANVSDAVASCWVSSKIVTPAALETPAAWVLTGPSVAAVDDHLNCSVMIKPAASHQTPEATFANVTLLMGAEGADESTSFTDESEDARTISVVGDAQIDTAQFKFGSSSALFDGTGDVLTVPDSDDFEFDQAMTVEFFVRFNTVGSALQTMIGKRNAGTAHGWIIYKHFVSPNSVLNAQGFDAGGSAWSVLSTTPLVANHQYHVALVRESGGLISLYLDGQLEDSVTESSVASTNTDPLRMGFDPSVSSRYLDGWLDEVRVTTGEAVYTAPFIPPIQAFPRS